MRNCDLFFLLPDVTQRPLKSRRAASTLLLSREKLRYLSISTTKQEFYIKIISHQDMQIEPNNSCQFDKNEKETKKGKYFSTRLATENRQCSWRP